MQHLLSEQQKQTIAEAIRQVEAQTQGEIVTVIAHSADDYLYIPLLWSALLALTFPGVAFFYQVDWDVEWLFMIQVMLFVVLAALLNTTPLKMHLIPKAVKHQRAARMAREQFVTQGVYHTAQHTGILLFVSVAERYVEILADQGINQKVPSGCWQAAVDGFVAQVKAKRYEQGFLDTIDYCGKYLIEHFPASRDNIDELPNHLVEIH